MIVVILLLAVYSITQMIESIATRNIGQTTGLAIAQEQLELVRNQTYDNVGTANTYPTGPLSANQTVTRNGLRFYVTLVINTVDDPADGNVAGTIPDKPQDTAPSDYKSVEVQVCWTNADCSNPLKLNTIISPKNVETAGNTGSLFINVVDAGGQPVPSATVSVTNPSPAVSLLNYVTDLNGAIQFLSLPPSIGTYHITVAKNGYTADGTVTPGGSNPNPTKPDTSVVVGEITATTFSIDRVSTMTIKSLDSETCGAVNAIGFRLRGQRLIGTPDVYAFDQTFTTDGSGQSTISNVPWDNYVLTLTSTNVDVAGVNPPDTIVVNPGSSVNVDVTLAAHAADTLRVVVLDPSGAPLTGANVRLTDGGAVDQTLITSQGSLNQTDWSGGSGQAQIGDPTKFYYTNGTVDSTNAGQVSLSLSASTPTVNEDFTSTANEDVGNTTAAWSISPPQVALAPDINNPGQYVAAGQAQSTTLNAQRGIITQATLTATSQLNGQTISYWLAADGSTFEPITPGVMHAFTITGSDLRWRAVLTTTDLVQTPILTGISLTYVLNQYAASGTLTSSTYDNGVATNFVNLSWLPISQPAAAGTDAVRWQVASNDDNAAWNFAGPDGAAGSYYAASGSSLNAAVSGHRYFRYRLFLQTADQSVSPTIHNVAVVKNNACTPPGQAWFSPLNAGTYSLDVSATGYQPSSSSISVSGQTVETITLTPTP